MVGKHVPDRPGPLALVGSEQVVELQRAGENREHRGAGSFIGQLENALVEPAKGEQLAVVEEFTPGAVGVVEHLARVVAVLQFERGQRNLASPQFFRTLLIRSLVFRRLGRIDFLAGIVQHQFRKHPVIGRAAPRLHRLRDGEGVAAFLTGGGGPAGRPLVRIELVATVGASCLLIVAVGQENPGALRAIDADFRFAVGIGIAGEDVGGKKVNAFSAGRTGNGLDPEEIRTSRRVPRRQSPDTTRGCARPLWKKVGRKLEASHHGQAGQAPRAQPRTRRD